MLTADEPGAPVSKQSTGVFGTCSNVFECWSARLVFRDKLIGGVPKDPKLIEGWLRAKAGLNDDAEVRQAMLRTLTELGAEVKAEMTFDDLVRASQAVASLKQTTGFKVGSEGLYVEARQ